MIRRPGFAYEITIEDQTMVVRNIDSIDEVFRRFRRSEGIMITIKVVRMTAKDFYSLKDFEGWKCAK